MTDILEKCARALWKRESERAAHCDDVFGAARGQAIKPTMDPFEDHREMWIGDVRAVIATLADGVDDQMALAAMRTYFVTDESIDPNSAKARYFKRTISAAIRAAIPEEQK